MEPGLSQLQLRAGGVLIVEDLIGSLIGGLCPVHIDLVRPLEGGGDQGDFAAGNAQHTADAGGAAALAVGDHDGPAHAQGGNVVDVTGQNGHIPAYGPDDQLLGLAVKDHAVGSDDLQMEGCHAFSPPRNLATTSSMEPANRK